MSGDESGSIKVSRSRAIAQLQMQLRNSVRNGVEGRADLSGFGFAGSGGFQAAFEVHCRL